MTIKNYHRQSDPRRLRESGGLWEHIDAPLDEAIDLRRILKPCWLEPNTSATAQDVARLMNEQGTTCVFTTLADGRQAIITQTDIRRIPQAHWSRLAQEIATTPLKTVLWDDPIRVALDTFAADGGRHRPVVGEDGKIIGVIRPRDIVQATLGWSVLNNIEFFDIRAVEHIDVQDACRRERLRLSVKATIGEVISTMNEFHGAAIRLPRTGKPLWILTESDLIRAAADGAPANTLVMEYASEVRDDDIMPITTTARLAVERMGAMNRRHVLIGDGDGPDDGNWVMIPRDILRAIVDLDPSSIAMPRSRGGDGDCGGG